MSKKKAMVAIYATHTEAESAVKELQKAGFDMKKLSIVGKDYHSEEHVIKGAPYFLSKITFRPFGPNVAFTASAS